MKKFIVFWFICILAVAFFSNFVYSSDIDLNLNYDENDYDSTVYGSVMAQPTTYTNADATVSVGTTAALSSSNLSLSNILNIILIVLGVLLVLFAIAILIRMR